MSDDHAEEQAMEAEALAAIFDTHFVVTENGQWTISIYPEQADDPPELDQLNHVGCRLVVTLPATYPEVSPQLQIDIIKGLTPDEHGVLLQQMAVDEAQANLGVPCIFAVAEVLREWLAAHNQKGLDDQSMHAQMMRKKKQQEETLVVSFHMSARAGFSFLLPQLMWLRSGRGPMHNATRAVDLFCSIASYGDRHSTVLYKKQRCQDMVRGIIRFQDSRQGLSKELELFGLYNTNATS